MKSWAQVPPTRRRAAWRRMHRRRSPWLSASWAASLVCPPAWGLRRRMRPSLPLRAWACGRLSLISEAVMSGAGLSAASRAIEVAVSGSRSGCELASVASRAWRPFFGGQSRRRRRDAWKRVFSDHGSPADTVLMSPRGWLALLTKSAGQHRKCPASHPTGAVCSSACPTWALRII